MTYLHTVRHQDDENELGNAINLRIHGYDTVTPFSSLLQQFTIFGRVRAHSKRLDTFWFLYHAAGRVEVVVWFV